MRHYLIIAAVGIVVVGVAVAAYFYFFTGGPSVVVAPNGTVSFPSAGQGTTPFTNNTNGGASSGGSPTTVSARLVKITSDIVVPGAAVVDIKAVNASSSPEVAVKYIERQSGNVFSYLVRVGTITRTSNRTVPGIQSAAWLPSASIAFVRYLSGEDFSTVNTYALPADDFATTSQGFFLSQNLSNIAVSSTSPVGNQISNGASVLTLASGVNGSVASVARADGTQSREVFSTPLAALRVAFAGKNQYLAFTKPSAALPGDAFLVDSAGHFARVAGPLGGLVALASPSGKFVLVSHSLNNTLQMRLVNTGTGEVIPLPVATIADKCVWTANEATIYCGIPLDPPAAYSYPDDWYQGAAHFSDRIWKIDVAGRFAQLVLDFPTETKDSLDAVALALNPAGTVLVFVNKNDGSLWSYAL